MFIYVGILPADTWIRLIVWMLIGFDIYLFYGVKHSLLGPGTFHRKGVLLVSKVGLALSALLIAVAYLHNASLEAGAEDSLFLISSVVAALHLIFFGYKLSQKRQDEVA